MLHERTAGVESVRAPGTRHPEDTFAGPVGRTFDIVPVIFTQHVVLYVRASNTQCQMWSTARIVRKSHEGQ